MLILLSHYLQPEAEASSVPLGGGADSLPGAPSLAELCLTNCSTSQLYCSTQVSGSIY
jgi:hypothetical protein